MVRIESVNYVCVCDHMSRCSVRSRISAAIHSSNSSPNKSLSVPDSVLNPQSLARLRADISLSEYQHGCSRLVSGGICFHPKLLSHGFRDDSSPARSARSNFMEMKYKQVSSGTSAWSRFNKKNVDSVFCGLSQSQRSCEHHKLNFPLTFTV